MRENDWTAAAQIDTPTYPPGYNDEMAHVVQQKKQLTARLNRIRGQIDAVERALDNKDTECINVLQLVAAARGAMSALMAELMAEHLMHHVVEPEPDQDPREAADELISIFKSYIK
jgi:DNA-binding FrmR family transcriptional regulator